VSGPRSSTSQFNTSMSANTKASATSKDYMLPIVHVLESTAPLSCPVSCPWPWNLTIRAIEKHLAIRFAPVVIFNNTQGAVYIGS
jgi:hypothetical protein